MTSQECAVIRCDGKTSVEMNIWRGNDVTKFITSLNDGPHWITTDTELFFFFGKLAARCILDVSVIIMNNQKREKEERKISSSVFPFFLNTGAKYKITN